MSIDQVTIICFLDLFGMKKSMDNVCKIEKIKLKTLSKNEWK